MSEKGRAVVGIYIQIINRL